MRIKNIKFNHEWIIVKAEQNTDNNECYFLIHKNFNIEGLNWQDDKCDSIIQSHIFQYWDLGTFCKTLKQKNIDLVF